MTDPYDQLLGPSGNPIRRDSVAEGGPERQDAISNTFSGLGSGSDRHQYTEPDARAELDVDDLDQWYEAGVLYPTIVDRPARDAVGEGFHILVDQEDVPEGVDANELDEEGEDFEGVVSVLGDRLRELGVDNDCFDAIRFSRAFGGAGLVVITDDDSPLHDSRNADTFTRVESTHVFDRFELTPREWITDLEHERFGDPSHYIFHPDQRGGPAVKEGEPVGSVIHHSRLIPFFGRQLRQGRDDRWDGWGQPLGDRIQEVLLNLESALEATASMTHDAENDILKIKGLVQKMGSAEGRQKVKRRIELMELTKSLINAVALDADMEDLEKRTANFSGLIAAIQEFKEHLSMVSRVPLTILYGQTPQGLSSNDETGRDNYHDFLRVELRKKKLTPPAREIARLLFLERASGFDRVPDYQIYWPALDDDDKKQQAETDKAREQAKKARADRHRQDVQMQVISSQESRRLRYPDLAADDRAESYEQMEQARDRLRTDGQDVYPSEYRQDYHSDQRPSNDPAVRASDDEPEKQRKGDVGYVNSSPGSEECSGCSYFRPDPAGKGGSCLMVRGQIAESGWCRLWGTRKLALGQTHQDTAEDLPPHVADLLAPTQDKAAE